jgi:hypothetical protein
MGLLIASLAALAAGPIGGTREVVADDPPYMFNPERRYPMAKGGDTLEAIETWSAVPRDRRLHVGDFGGMPAIVWIGHVMRSYPDGSDRSTAVIFAKVLPKGPGEREKARQRLREARQTYGCPCPTLAMWRAYEGTVGGGGANG